MSKKFSLWGCIIKVLDNYKIDEPIFRSVLISDIEKLHLDRKDDYDRYSRTSDGLSFNVGSFDMYRDLLTKIRVLKPIGRGIYSKTQEIPKNLTSNQAHKLRIEMKYHPSWKDWFALSLEDRIKMLGK